MCVRTTWLIEPCTSAFSDLATHCRYAPRRRAGKVRESLGEKKETSDTTRRDFVKTAGLTLVAAAIGGAAGSYLSRAPPEISTVRPVRAKGRALFFDVGGTILDWTVMPDKLSKFFGDRGLTVDTKAFWPAWRGKLFTYMMFNSLIGAGYLPLEELGRRATMALTKSLKIDLKPADAGGITDLLKELDVYPDVKPGVVKMRELGYLLVPHTQLGSDLLKKALLDRFDFQWDWSFSGDMYGVYKPHRSMYLKAIDAMGLDRSEVIYVTTNQFDLFGSKGVGLRTAWVNRWKETLEPYGYTPNWQVNDFVELAKVLETERP